MGNIPVLDTTRIDISVQICLDSRGGGTKNVVLSWQSELSPNSVNKQNPRLLDRSENGVVPLVVAICGTSSRLEEVKGI